MDHKRNWVFRRSNVANRLQKEELGTRLKLYKELETILSTDTENSANEEMKTTASNKEVHWSHEDSALGMSLNGETFSGTTVGREILDPKEETKSEITDTVESSDDSEENLQSISQTSESEMSDWERAEEFHAALGPELDVVRQQIANILNDEYILFPLELISRLYLQYGRRLPQLYEGYSTRNLLAWLKCNSRLELDHLMFV